MAWLLLLLAIGSEITGTLALKASDGFSRWYPSVIVVLGYAAAFVFLGVALKSVPVGIAYAIWSGLGTAGAAAGALLIFGERLSVLAVAGIVVVIVGVVLVTLGQEGV
ncbi:MAG: SMR family transporter [Actinomycetes bacterium]